MWRIAIQRPVKAHEFTVALALLLLVVSCASGRRGRASLRSSGQATGTHVVVRPFAALHTAPDRRAPRVPLARWGYTAFRLIDRRGDDWVELETPGREGRGQCSDHHHSLEPLALRVFARADALVLVSTGEVTRTYHDGTGVTLRPGVPLEALGDGRVRAHLRAVGMVIDARPGEAAATFRPRPPSERGFPGSMIRPEAVRQGRVLYNGWTPLTEDHPPGHGDLGLAVYGRLGRRPTDLVDVSIRCGELRVKAPHQSVHSLRFERISGPTPTPPDLPRAAAGLSVFWRHGARAGVVREPFSLSREVSGPTGMRCFEVALGPRGGPDVTVCFRSSEPDGSGGGPSREAPGRRLDAPR